MAGDLTRRQERQFRKMLANGKTPKLRFKIQIPRKQRKVAQLRANPSKGRVEFIENEAGEIVALPFEVTYTVE